MACNSVRLSREFMLLNKKMPGKRWSSFRRKILSRKISVACCEEGYNDEIISLNILSISFRDNKQKPRVEEMIVIFYKLSIDWVLLV